MQVREYRADDVPAIVALFRDTVRRVNSRDYSSEQVEAWAPDEIDVVAWAHRLARRFTVVAEIDDRVAGFADLEDDGHLDHLYVHADHQRRGVGRALLAVIEARSRLGGLPSLFTESSITARPFFERLGFVTLQEQVVECRGVEMVNFRMAKDLVDG
jgi:putative acetyltransferase